MVAAPVDLGHRRRLRCLHQVARRTCMFIGASASASRKVYDTMHNGSAKQHGVLNSESAEIDRRLIVRRRARRRAQHAREPAAGRAAAGPAERHRFAAVADLPPFSDDVQVVPMATAAERELTGCAAVARAVTGRCTRCSARNGAGTHPHLLSSCCEPVQGDATLSRITRSQTWHCGWLGCADLDAARRLRCQ